MSIVQRGVLVVLGLAVASYAGIAAAQGEASPSAPMEWNEETIERLKLEKQKRLKQIDALRAEAARAKQSEDHAGAADTYHQLGSDLAAFGKFEQAEDAYRESLAAHTRNGAPQETIAKALLYIASTKRFREQWQEAKPLYTEAIKLLEGADRAKTVFYATALASLADVNLSLGEPELAHRQAEQARQLVVELGSPIFETRLPWLVSANALYELNQIDDAIKLLTELQQAFEQASNPPETRRDHATLVMQLARCYHSQGDWRRAEEYFVQAVRACQASFGPASRSTVAALLETAIFYRQWRQPAKAEQLAECVLKICRHCKYEEPEILALTLLASLDLDQGRNDAADERLQAALESHDRHNITRGKTYLEVTNALARLHVARDDLPKAEQVVREQIQLLDETVGRNNPKLEPYLHRLEQLVYQQRKQGGGPPTDDEALPTDDEAEVPLLPGEAPGFRAAAVRHLEAKQYAAAGKAFGKQGIALANGGDLDGAQRAFQRSLATYERLGEASVIERANVLRLIAQCYEQRHQWRESAEKLDERLKLYEVAGLAKTERYARVLNVAARAYDFAGDAPTASKRVERAKQLCRELQEPISDHPWIWLRSAHLTRRLGNTDEALETLHELRRAAHDANINAPRSAPMPPHILAEFARCYEDKDDWRNADRYYQHFKEVCLASDGPQSSSYADSLLYLASFYETVGRLAEAEELAEQAIHIRQERNETDVPDFAPYLLALASIHLTRNQPDKAEQQIHTAFELLRNAKQIEGNGYANALSVLAKLHVAREKYSQADKALRAAIELRENIPGENLAELVPYLERHAAILTQLDRNEEAAAVEARASKLSKTH